jgi:hypothetical protein
LTSPPRPSKPLDRFVRSGPPWSAAATALLLLAVRPLSGQELSGRVILAPDSVGAGGAVVQLHRVASDSGEVVDSVQADARGRFRFVLDDFARSETVFLVAARHAGALHFGPPLPDGMTPPDPYEVVVYDTAQVTQPVPDLEVEMRHAVLSPVPGGGLRVEEIMDIVGRPDQTLVPVPETSSIWETPLPPDASDAVVIPGGVPPESVTFEGGRVQLRSRLPPAGVRLAVRYVLPTSDFELALAHTTRRLAVMVGGVGVSARAEGLVGSRATDVSGETLQRFSGSDLPAGTSISVHVEVSTHGTWWAWIWLVLGIGLGTAAALVWRLDRRGIVGD